MLRKQIMNKVSEKVSLREKDESNNLEKYKYLFETSKHFTTLDAGLLAFLGSIKLGIVPGKPLNTNSVWILLFGLAVSIFTSSLALFLISLATKSEKPNLVTKFIDSYWGTVIIFLGEFVSFIAALFYLLMVSVG